MDPQLCTSLGGGVAYVPGGRDREGRPLIVVRAATEPEAVAPPKLDLLFNYYASMFSAETRHNGLSVVVSAPAAPAAAAVARATVRQVALSLGRDLATLLVLRPDAFWDKQRVENCTKSAVKQGQPIHVPLSRLHKYVALSQLPEELGGQWPYDHNTWLNNRTLIEGMYREGESASTELERMRQKLTSFEPRGAAEEDGLEIHRELYENGRGLANRVSQAGKEITRRLEMNYIGQALPQDFLDSRARIVRLLDVLAGKAELLTEAWNGLERRVVRAQEIARLEEGVAKVVDWILSRADAMLNAQQEVGHDVASAEELRRAHEELELQCRETYGQYAELLHRIDTLPSSHEDLKSQRDFMDFVCRSFATRLERRRNVLISSQRFFRLVAEYFEQTSDVFESLVKRCDLNDLKGAGATLILLEQSQQEIECLEREVTQAGERLADILSMPVKDALGRDVVVATDREADIRNVHHALDATISRKNLFGDSVELHKLTLQQISHIYAYEQDARQAITWLFELRDVMLREHGHVGCHEHEIQIQKTEYQAFQETAKGTFEYGRGLLSASLALRVSCRLPPEENRNLTTELNQAWRTLSHAAQEQMTRLRVSAVFHRTVQQHCIQLAELLTETRSVMSGTPEGGRKRLHRLINCRESLMQEVGRMARLGRLLRTRLREPLCDEQRSVSCGSSDEGTNATGIEAVSERLRLVTEQAELLDSALSQAQTLVANAEEDEQSSSSLLPTAQEWASSSTGGNLVTSTPKNELNNPNQASNSSSSSSPAAAAISSSGTGGSGSGSGSGSHRRRTGGGGGDSTGDELDEDFVTVSECTCEPSRSSSFHTASECGGAASPWWDEPEPPNTEAAKVKHASPPMLKTITEYELRSQVVVEEVTETTRMRLSYSPPLDVTSLIGRRNVVGRVSPAAATSRVSSAEDNGEPPPPAKPEVTLEEEHLIDQMKEVGEASEGSAVDGIATYLTHHQYIARHAIKGIL